MPKKNEYRLKGRNQSTSEYRINQNRKVSIESQPVNEKILWNSSVEINSCSNESQSHRSLKIKSNTHLN
ncbi:unnamed protein product [Heterobilharzia americana]|nr:unnamed protein product [Heterobilharzia americana]